MWYAAAFNSFASGAHDYSHHLNGKPPVTQLVERAAIVKALTDLDLNYPDLAEYGNAAAIRGASVMGVRDPFLSASRRYHQWHDGKPPRDKCTSVVPAYCDRLYHYTNADRSCNARMR
jgi:hypothetical protein